METNLDISHPKLLLVEDNPRYLKQLEKSLARFGYQHLDTARDAAEASEKLAPDPNLDTARDAAEASEKLAPDPNKHVYEIIIGI